MVINIFKDFLDEETIDCSISASFTLEKLLPLWLVALGTVWCLWPPGWEQNCHHRTVIDMIDWLLTSSPTSSFVGFLFSKSWEAETHISHYLLKLSCWVWISFCPLDTHLCCWKLRHKSFPASIQAIYRNRRHTIVIVIKDKGASSTLLGSGRH